MAALAMGCNQQSASNTPVAGVTNSGTKTFEVKGVVHDVMPDKDKVKVAHEAIPGYMAAMTMTFEVKDPKELGGIKPGDSIAFKMVVTERDGWIENIRKLSTNATSVANAPENFRRVRDVEPLEVGNEMPEYHFTNELGKAVSFADYKGQAVALTFIYTRCPFPTFCPRMSLNFMDAQKKLESTADTPTNWHLFTITFDPEFDTPSVLREYAKSHGADEKHWSFLTGDLIDVTAIAEQCGLLFWRPDTNQPAGISHNLRTMVIDPRGRIFKIFSENQWTGDDLAKTLIEASKIKS
ncbi:MAG TPA: SCO family protein [Verrucomicrobiae bacterium]